MGGSASARRALILAVLAAVRQAVGRDFLLIYRLSMLGWSRRASRAEVIELGQAVAAAGVDLLSAGIGWRESRVPTLDGSVPPGAFRWVTGLLREQLPVPLIAGNRIDDTPGARRVNSGGRGGRSGWPWPARCWPMPPGSARRRGGRRRRSSCVACNQGCLDRVLEGETISCLVSPQACHETVRVSAMATLSKRLAVIGGGPAGLAFACQAAERGHGVTLYERGRRSVVNCYWPAASRRRRHSGRPFTILNSACRLRQAGAGAASGWSRLAEPAGG